jgi:hypothetical protein
MKFLSDILAKAGLTVDGVVTLNNTATGQTPASNDNSTKLATTAWVRTFVQPYSLPIASTSILGGIKVGTGLSIDAGSGILSVTGGGAASIKSTQTFTATAAQTVFTITGGYSVGLIDVFLNGVYLSPNQTTATNGTTITLGDAAAAGDIIDVIVASPVYEGATTTTDQLSEGTTNLYFTNTRARSAVSLTTTGVSGVATYNSSTGVFNIPNYQGLVPSGGTVGQILTKNSSTDYDSAWIENYAEWTAVLKHRVKSGEAITKGQAVYVSSADGTNIIVSKASNATEGTSSKTMGLLESTVSTNGFTNVITEGLLGGLNTATATAGDPVWLGTGGNLIYGLLNKPYAPAHLVFIGIVTRVNANNGEIFVKVQNGFELEELHDLSVKNASDGDMIKYVASTGLWTKIAATTTNITEGTNLYYTQGRFDTAFTAKSTTNLSEGTNLYYTQARFDTAFTAKSTTNLTEGTNLYYTTARFDTRLATKSTTDLAEGTNLYYTTARANSDFDTRLATKSTTNLAEGTNLYYTDARVGTYLTNNSYATQTYVNTAVSNLVDAAPGTLDTLNELAAALGDDPNFATTVATSIGTKEPAITAGTTSQYWRGDKSWQTLPVYTLSGLGGVPTTRTITINGTAQDLSADRTFTINSMVYPGAGIALSTGTAWGTSITDNSANWNTAFGWGNHASGGYLTTASAASTYVSLSGSYANPSWITSLAYSKITGVPAFITSYTEVDTLASVTGRGASTTSTITINRNVAGLAFNRDSVANYNGIYYQTAGTSKWFIGMRENLSSNNHIHYSEQITQDVLTLNVANGNATIYGNLAAANFSGSSSGTNTGDQTLSGLGGQPQLNGTGFVKISGTTISYDNNTYLTSLPSHNHDGRYIRLDTVNEQDGIVAYFRPVTSGGYTMMKFESKVNQASDYGWILMQDDSANTNGAPGAEDIRMTIGVFNDFQGPGVHSDELWFQGGARLVQNVGLWDSEYNTIIGTPSAKINGTTYEWRINNSSVMAISFGGVLSVSGNTVYHAGNLTNLNQLTNGPGYITGYTETDTLATVVARGATTLETISVGNSANGLTGLNIRRGRLCFSGSYEANHSIYNNNNNLDGLGVWDGMKMNVYLGLDIRTGNHDAATTVVAVRPAGVVVTGTISATNLSGTNTGDQTNISGNAATATNVAWTGVTGRPTVLSSFTNDLGNYGSWVTSSGTVNAAYVLNYNGLGSATTNISSGQSQVLRNENGSGGNLSYAPVLHLAASDTMWQIQGDYYDSTTLRWRAGYAGTWYAWRTIYHSGNLTNLNQLTNGPGYITGESDTLATVTARGASTATAVTFSGGLNVASSKVGFRNAGLTEFIQGESWTTGFYGYNSNDGFLFYQRDTSDVAHPCFHIGAWNNAGYGGYANADSMITLVRGDGTKTDGATYATRGLSSSSYYTNIIKTTGGTIFKDSQSSHAFTGSVVVNGTGIYTAGDGGAGSQATVVAIRVRGLGAYESLEIGTENNYDAVLRSYGNDIRYYSGHWRTVGNVSSENHSHYWYTSKAGSTNWSSHKMRLDHDGILTVASHISTPGNVHANRSRIAFSSTATDANHSIYNNYNNIDAEGSFDGMKMNVYAGLLVRVGNASGAVPTTALDVTSTRTSIATGQLWCGASNSRDGAVGLVLNDGALHVRAHNDFYHKIWYYDGIAFGTNSAHGHFRFYAESATQRGSTAGGATLRFDMDSTNGNFWAGGDVTAYSDARVKTDVKVIENSIEKVKSIRGVTFLRSDAQEQHKEKRHAGVIAQEILEVLPEIVTENEDGMYSVAYGNMAGLFIEAIKEQQTQIESQKSEIDVLKDLVQQLINR